MKKLFAKILTLTLALCLGLTVLLGSACGNKKVDYASKDSYVVGICQLVPHEALDAATKGFRDALKEKVEAAGKTVTFKEVNAQNDVQTCTTIINDFVSNNVDLIMANATPALQAAESATNVIPILATSITEYGTALGIKDFKGTVGSNISGTSDLAPLDKQADIITELLPNAKKVGLVYCSAEANSKYQVDTIKKILTDKGLTVNVHSFSDSNDIQTVVEEATNKNDVLYIPTDNTAATNAGLIGDICSKAGIPVVAGEEGICKNCGIATLSISYENIGRVTGEMAAKILLVNAEIEKMAIEYDKNPVYKYNEELCAKYGINVDTTKYQKIG